MRDIFTDRQSSGPKPGEEGHIHNQAGQNLEKRGIFTMSNEQSSGPKEEKRGIFTMSNNIKTRLFFTFRPQ